MRIHHLLLILAAALAAPAVADDTIPCEGFPNLTQIPYPQTGFWYNPEQSGIGFNLELQNGVLGGTWFGYDAHGVPIWYLLSGTLQAAADDQDVQWVFDADALRFEGGPCLGCAFTAPAAPEPVARVRIEFLQRHLACFRVDGGEWTTIWPLTFGSEVHAPFPNTAFPLPDLRGSWVLAFRDTPRRDPHDPRSEQGPAEQMQRYLAKVTIGIWQYGLHATPLAFAAIAIPYSRVEEVGYGGLRCPTTERGIECYLEQEYDRWGKYLNPPKIYHIPLGSIGNRRFHGEADDGATVTGYRIAYD